MLLIEGDIYLNQIKSAVATKIKPTTIKEDNNNSINNISNKLSSYIIKTLNFNTNINKNNLFWKNIIKKK